MKKFIVDPEFWEIFPEAAIGVLSVRNVRETAKISDKQVQELKNLLAEANEIAKKYVPTEPISQNPLVQIWREAYRRFPTKKGARVSIEALLKRIMHGKPIGSIAPSVDITNAISLRYGFPIGVEDCDKFEGDLHLGTMKGNEDFLPIGETEQDPPLPGEIAYYDKLGVVCRCWNWRDGQRTQITDATTSEFVAMECIEKDRIPELREAIDSLAVSFEKYLGAYVVAKRIVTAENSEMELE